MKAGDIVQNYFPWLTGVRKGTVLEKRVPMEGEYYMSGRDVVQRKGTGYLSTADAKREYWIIQLLE